ncbi:MAG: metal ABC transporter substrate-binding protein [Lachnospiraceae bacterium]|nr:metal ABC transporter substrate-binding protein [Lachnospiraceae bacterium]
MRRFLILCLVLTLTVPSLVGCGASSASASGEAESLRVVTTIFPVYDWVREILSGNDEANLIFLADDGVDMHSFQPTVEDILNISTCDLFIYVGGESDQWVEDALQGAVNEEMQVINLMDVLGEKVQEEEIVEGMEGEDDDGEEAEYDEHIWLSLRNAETLSGVIAETLAKIDPEHAELYTENAAAYTEELSALDASYQEAVDTSTQNALLFGDRFPFRYLVDDYGLSYYAAFAGCSSETEASFETIVFLAGKVDELELGSILTIENSDQTIATAIQQNTQDKNQQILTMHSMQSVTLKEAETGTTYLSLAEENLEVLREALK